MSRPIVDLKRSDWDRKQSDPQTGKYVFTKKVYYKNKDFAEGYIHPYKLKWCKYSEYDSPRPFASFHKWKQIFKATPVVVGDDYWPEGFAPDSEGHYTYIDLILVKIPIEVHVEHKRQAIAKSNRQADSVKMEFVAKTKKAGIDIPEEMIDEEIERLKKETRAFGI